MESAGDCERAYGGGSVSAQKQRRAARTSIRMVRSSTTSWQRTPLCMASDVYWYWNSLERQDYLRARYTVTHSPGTAHELFLAITTPL
jgi:hypothetical protein